MMNKRHRLECMATWPDNHTYEMISTGCFYSFSNSNTHERRMTPMIDHAIGNSKWLIEFGAIPVMYLEPG